MKVLIFCLWIYLYSIGIKIPAISLLFLTGVKLKLNKNIFQLFIIVLILVIKSIIFSKDSFWVLENLKILDGFLFLILSKPVRHNKIDLIKLSILLIIISFSQSLNENFSGWLIFVVFLIYDIRISKEKNIKYFLVIITLSYISFYFKSYTSAVLIILYPLLRVFFKPKQIFIISLLTTISIISFLPLIQNYSNFQIINSIFPTLIIRFVMWSNVIDNLNILDILFGKTYYLSNFYSSIDGNIVQSPFIYIGKSTHNILIDILSKHGIFILMFFVFLIFRLIKKNNYLILPLILLWSLEPGLGSFQITSIAFIFLSLNQFHAYNLYSKA